MYYNTNSPPPVLYKEAELMFISFNEFKKFIKYKSEDAFKKLVDDYANDIKEFVKDVTKQTIIDLNNQIIIVANSIIKPDSGIADVVYGYIFYDNFDTTEDRHVIVTNDIVNTGIKQKALMHFIEIVLPQNDDSNIITNTTQ